MATKYIAFHTYKGGTGKTTIASSFSALLAKSGYSVCLLDLDVYALACSHIGCANEMDK
jgi:chromosome partitioning protein